MKYIAPGTLFLLGNEIISLLALSIMMLLFAGDLMKARMDK